MKAFLALAVAITTLAASAAMAQFKPPSESWQPLMTGLSAPSPSATVFAGSKAVSQCDRVTPGQTFYVALDLRIKHGWVYYSPHPGESNGFSPLAAGLDIRIVHDSQPTSPSASPPVARHGEPLWPVAQPHTASLGGSSFTNNGYEGRAVVFVPVTIDKTARAGERYRVEALVQGQVCGEEKCLRLDGVILSATFEVAAEGLASSAWTADVSAGLPRAVAASMMAVQSPRIEPLPIQSIMPSTRAADYGVLGMLMLALGVGIVLNVMPCVLPVIPLKVLGIVEQAAQSRRRFVTLGLAFAGGIVLFFVAIAAVNLIVKLVVGDTFQWGQQFQYPPLLIAMALLMVLLAMNMFGLFHVLVPNPVAGLEHKVRGKGHLSAIGMGLFTGVLSTPCSFAPLTTAFGWAVGEGAVLGTLGIVTIGVGMALPYAVLTAFPSLLSRLPKPGAWMERFKQSLGFVLLLVAIWLLSALASESWPFWVAAFGVVLAFGLWMWGSWVRYDAPLGRKIAIRGVAVAMVAAGGWFMLPPPQPSAVAFEEFDQAQIDAALADGRPVLIDFTAAWCANCKVVEATVYDDSEVAAELTRRNVLAVKGDITHKDLPANALKKKLRIDIPTTALYVPGRKEPILLPGMFGKGQLLDELAKIQPPRGAQ